MDGMLTLSRHLEEIRFRMEDILSRSRHNEELLLNLCTKLDQRVPAIGPTSGGTPKILTPPVSDSLVSSHRDPLMTTRHEGDNARCLPKPVETDDVARGGLRRSAFRHASYEVTGNFDESPVLGLHQGTSDVDLDDGSLTLPAGFEGRTRQKMLVTPATSPYVASAVSTTTTQKTNRDRLIIIPTVGLPDRDILSATMGLPEARPASFNESQSQATTNDGTACRFRLVEKHRLEWRPGIHDIPRKVIRNKHGETSFDAVKNKVDLLQDLRTLFGESVSATSGAHNDSPFMVDTIDDSQWQAVVTFPASFDDRAATASDANGMRSLGDPYRETYRRSPSMQTSLTGTTPMATLYGDPDDVSRKPNAAACESLRLCKSTTLCSLVRDSAKQNRMREPLHISGDQCGNQIGAMFWDPGDATLDCRRKLRDLPTRTNTASWLDTGLLHSAVYRLIKCWTSDVRHLRSTYALRLPVLKSHVLSPLDGVATYALRRLRRMPEVRPFRHERTSRKHVVDLPVTGLMTIVSSRFVGSRSHGDARPEPGEDSVCDSDDAPRQPSTESLEPEDHGSVFPILPTVVPYCTSLQLTEMRSHDGVRTQVLWKAIRKNVVAHITTSFLFCLPSFTKDSPFDIAETKVDTVLTCIDSAGRTYEPNLVVLENTVLSPWVRFSTYARLRLRRTPDVRHFRREHPYLQHAVDRPDTDPRICQHARGFEQEKISLTLSKQSRRFSPVKFVKSSEHCSHPSIDKAYSVIPQAMSIYGNHLRDSFGECEELHTDENVLDKATENFDNLFRCHQSLLNGLMKATNLSDADISKFVTPKKKELDWWRVQTPIALSKRVSSLETDRWRSSASVRRLRRWECRVDPSWNDHDDARGRRNLSDASDASVRRAAHILQARTQAMWTMIRNFRRPPRWMSAFNGAQTQELWKAIWKNDIAQVTAPSLFRLSSSTKDSPFDIAEPKVNMVPTALKVPDASQRDAPEDSGSSTTISSSFFPPRVTGRTVSVMEFNISSRCTVSEASRRHASASSSFFLPLVRIAGCVRSTMGLTGSWSFGITALELARGHAPLVKYPPMKAPIEGTKPTGEDDALQRMYMCPLTSQNTFHLSWKQPHRFSPVQFVKSLSDQKSASKPVAKCLRDATRESPSLRMNCSSFLLPTLRRSSNGVCCILVHDGISMGSRRSFSFASAAEAAAERRRRTGRLPIEPPLYALGRDRPRPPVDRNAPRLPGSTSALVGLLNGGRIEEVKLLREMLNKGHSAGSLAFNNLISGFLHHEDLEKGYVLFDELEEHCLVYDGVVHATCMDWIFVQGRDKAALELCKSLLEMTDSLEMHLERVGGVMTLLILQHMMIPTKKEQAFLMSSGLHDAPRRVWNPGIDLGTSRYSRAGIMIGHGLPIRTVPDGLGPNEEEEELKMEEGGTSTIFRSESQVMGRKEEGSLSLLYWNEILLGVCVHRSFV